MSGAVTVANTNNVAGAARRELAIYYLAFMHAGCRGWILLPVATRVLLGNAVKFDTKFH